MIRFCPLREYNYRKALCHTVDMSHLTENNYSLAHSSANFFKLCRLEMLTSIKINVVFKHPLRAFCKRTVRTLIWST